MRGAHRAGTGAELSGKPVSAVSGDPHPRHQAGTCQHRDGLCPLCPGTGPGLFDSAGQVFPGGSVRRQHERPDLFPAGRRHCDGSDDRSERIAVPFRLWGLRGRCGSPQLRAGGGSSADAGQYGAPLLSACFAGGIPLDRGADWAGERVLVPGAGTHESQHGFGSGRNTWRARRAAEARRR